MAVACPMVHVLNVLGRTIVLGLFGVLGLKVALSVTEGLLVGIVTALALDIGWTRTVMAVGYVCTVADASGHPVSNIMVVVKMCIGIRILAFVMAVVMAETLVKGV